ncbi:MAG: hypothetical protein DRI80_16040 [Chloroflexota bacterium]|nr:MAG: hypothetical protein DRI80_16040 [Chloroflexota bacterium]
MKPRITITIILALATLLLAACSGGESPAPASLDADESSTLDASYDNALAVRNQLALGTLNLEDTPQAVTADQAATLIPLWQALRGTMNSGAAAQAEVDALLKQIEGAMSAEQLSTIRAMKLTQGDLRAWAQSQGLSAGTGSGSGVGSGQPRSGQGLSPEERATRQAEREAQGSNSGGLSKALIDAVITLLESK